MDFYTFATPTAAAITLGVLWVAEGVSPLFDHRREPGRWRRHLVLALGNAAVGGAIAGGAFAAIRWADHMGFGLVRWLPLERVWQVTGMEWLGLVLGLLLGCVLLDGWQYSFHRCAHKVPWLWRLHGVHHTDEDVDATSAARFHTGEIAIQGMFAIGVYVLLGVSIQAVLVYQLILVINNLFHHANLALPPPLDAVLKWVIVTPNMHVVHHSKWQPETDSNFAAVFSFWDRLFGSFRYRPDPRTIERGLNGFTNRHRRTLMGMLSQPFSRARASYGQAPNPDDLPEQSRRGLNAPTSSSTSKSSPSTNPPTL